MGMILPRRRKARAKGCHAQSAALGNWVFCYHRTMADLRHDALFPPRRPLGRTGFVATVLGIGDVADRRLPIEQCVSTARRAIDAGLNVIDTAPNYEDGYSEQIVGQAVKGVRDRMFLISKIDHHD